MSGDSAPQHMSFSSGPTVPRRIPQVLRSDSGRRKGGDTGLTECSIRCKAGGKEATKAKVERSAKERASKGNADRMQRTQEALNRSRGTSAVHQNDNNATNAEDELQFLELKLRGFRDQIIVIANTLRPVQQGAGLEDDEKQDEKIQNLVGGILRSKDVRPFGGAGGAVSPSTAVENAIGALDEMSEVLLAKVTSGRGFVSASSSSPSVSVRPLIITKFLLQFLSPASVGLLSCPTLLSAWPQLLVGILKVLQVLNLCAMKRTLVDVPPTGDEPSIGGNEFHFRNLLSIVKLVNQAEPGDPLARVQEPTVLLTTVLPQLYNLLDSRVNSSSSKNDIDNFCLEGASAFCGTIFFVNRSTTSLLIQQQQNDPPPDPQQHHLFPLYSAALRGLETSLQLWSTKMKQNEDLLLSSVVHLQEALVICTQLLDHISVSSSILSATAFGETKKSVLKILLRIVSSGSVCLVTLLMNAGLASSLQKFLAGTMKGKTAAPLQSTQHDHERVLLDRLLLSTFQMISHLFSGPLQQIQQVLDANTLPIILQEVASLPNAGQVRCGDGFNLPRSTSIECWKEAAWCVVNLIAQGTVEHVNYVVQLHGVTNLVKLCRNAHSLLVAIDNINGEGGPADVVGPFLPTSRQQQDIVTLEHCVGIAIEALDGIFHRLSSIPLEASDGGWNHQASGGEREKQSSPVCCWEAEARKQFIDCDGLACLIEITSPQYFSDQRCDGGGRKKVREIACGFLGAFFPESRMQEDIDSDGDAESALNHGVEHGLKLE